MRLRCGSALTVSEQLFFAAGSSNALLKGSLFDIVQLYEGEVVMSGDGKGLMLKMKVVKHEFAHRSPRNMPRYTKLLKIKCTEINIQNY